MLFKMKLSQMMVFRLSFFGAFFVDGSLFLIQLLVFNSIYSQVDSIGGWGKGEMIVFIGTFSLINAINMLLFFFGINDIPKKILSGSLDHYISKPVNPLLRLTFENINIGSIPLVFASIAIILYGISELNVSLTAATVAGYIMVVLLMVVLWYDTMLVLRSIPFFVISASNITQLENLLELCMKIPGVCFKGLFKFLFYFVLPYGVMATIPTQLLAQSLSLGGLLYGLFIVVLYTVLAFTIWHIGLRHYKSASS
jgi:ABC-2 type transport system permease protein